MKKHKLNAEKSGRVEVARRNFIKTLRRDQPFSKPLAIGVSLIFAVVMVIAILRVFAAGTFVSFEPEVGNVTSPAAVVANDSSASGNKLVKFNAPAINPTPPPPPPPTSGNTILFDDFTGSSIDTTKWDVYDRVSDQDNHELNCVIPGNITISGGMLNGITKHEDHTCGDSNVAPFLNHYTSWQIGQKTAPFKYGTVEVRAKEPGGTGIWPTIFLLGNSWQASQAATADVPGSNWPNGSWGEVDIAEFLNNSRTQVNNVAHVNMNGGTVLANLPFNATSRFMVYRLQWTSTALIYSVDAEDGVGFRTLRTITDTNNIPQVPYYLTINAAVGGNGGGTPDPNTFPQTFQIDWIRITQ